METYETLSEAMTALQRQGYTYNFSIEDTVLKCQENRIRLKPEEFVIDKVFRFEGETDPGDENILYAISTRTRALKGLLVSAYGPYSDTITAEIASRLAMQK